MVMEVFSRAAKRQGDLDEHGFAEAILRERPDLRGQRPFAPGQGAYGHVIFLGGEVFKGPQSLRSKTYAEVISGIDEEIAVLQLLRGRGLPVPEITCVGRESVFFGMTRLPGQTLGGDFERMYSDAEKRLLAQDIIGFVVDMANAAPLRDGAFLSHDDLSCRNILVDPRTRRLSGVIDFGMVRYCTTDMKDHKKGWIPRGGHEPAFMQMLDDEFALRSAEIRGFPADKSPAALHRLLPKIP